MNLSQRGLCEQLYCELRCIGCYKHMSFRSQFVHSLRWLEVKPNTNISTRIFFVTIISSNYEFVSITLRNCILNLYLLRPLPYDRPDLPRP